MNTIGFISDLHLSESKRLNDAKEVLDSVRDYISMNALDYLVILGDVFDSRKPSPKELRVFNDFVTSVRPWLHGNFDDRITIVVGNHDTDGDVSALSYLSDLDVPGLSIVEPPYKFFKFYLDHRPLSGAEVGEGLKMYSGANLDDIVKDNPDCEVFAFGDYHKPQVLKESPFCFYAGSIHKVSFSERNDTKYLWVFKGTNLDRKVALPGRPMVQFDINVKVDEDSEVPWRDKDYDGYMCKIVYHGTREALKQLNVRNLIGDSLFYSVKVEYDVLDSNKSRNESITESVRDEDALESYFSKLDFDDDYKRDLLEAGKQIIKESKNVSR